MRFGLVLFVDDRRVENVEIARNFGYADTRNDTALH